MERDDIVIDNGDNGLDCLSGETAQMILEDYAALKRGEVIDAFEALEEIRAKHEF